jgi:hypothetical protein
MKRLLIIFVCSFLICWATVAFAWVVGILISCFFVDGCYQQIHVSTVINAINIKSVFVRGSLLASVFLLFFWVNVHRK